MTRETINAKNAPAAVGPNMVHAVKAGETLYTSGQLGGSATGELPKVLRLRQSRHWKI